MCTVSQSFMAIHVFDIAVCFCVHLCPYSYGHHVCGRMFEDVR